MTGWIPPFRLSWYCLVLCSRQPGQAKPLPCQSIWHGYARQSYARQTYTCWPLTLSSYRLHTPRRGLHNLSLQEWVRAVWICYWSRPSDGCGNGWLLWSPAFHILPARWNGCHAGAIALSYDMNRYCSYRHRWWLWASCVDDTDICPYRCIICWLNSCQDGPQCWKRCVLGRFPQYFHRFVAEKEPFGW